jgi:glycosyltransferase involved in cell wall biosynthesis
VVIRVPDGAAVTSLAAPPAIWLLQDGEPLPIDENAHLMRTGDQARRLIEAGYEVVWWTSRFIHNLKEFRGYPDTWCRLSPRYRIALLDGPGYRKNMSWRRVRHYRAIAAHFAALSSDLPVPALVLASYPSPELSDAGRRYAVSHDIPFVVDIRDPWPDIFPDYLPVGLRWSLLPVLWHYRRKVTAIMRDATTIVAVSQAMLDWGLAYAGRTRRELDRVFYIGFHEPTPERKIAVPVKFTPDDPLVCLFATTCGKSSNGEMLIDAARILETAGERRVRFIVAGDGERLTNWLDRARGLSIVHFAGWTSQEQLQAYSQTAHLGIVLLRGGIARYWLGNRLFEYLSASLGVINDVSGEPADIVASHGVGLNMRREDPSGLALGLRSLADEPQRVRGFMENARRASSQQFDPVLLQSRYVEHLFRLIRDHPKRPVQRLPITPQQPVLAADTIAGVKLP